MSNRDRSHLHLPASSPRSEVLFQNRTSSAPRDCYELSVDGEIKDGRLVCLPPLWRSADHNKRSYDLTKGEENDIQVIDLGGSVLPLSLIV